MHIMQGRFGKFAVFVAPVAFRLGVCPADAQNRSVKKNYRQPSHTNLLVESEWIVCHAWWHWVLIVAIGNDR
jgi:hypothetical protein